MVDFRGIKAKFKTYFEDDFWTVIRLFSLLYYHSISICYDVVGDIKTGPNNAIAEGKIM
jgi:hypothetical protein